MKRFFDICLSIVGLLILLFPLMLLAFLVRYKLGSPIFFRQVRPGLKGRPFSMIKFRTMSNGIDSDGVDLPDSERLTSFGIWLRSTSLDELPELWNVLRGEMSLVGPRPLLMQYLPLYTFEQARRHEVRPGITGWAQINGRNAIGWAEKFDLDVWYVDNNSLILDIQIIYRTIATLFHRKNINADGNTTMPPFLGNKNK
jgi:lipopolysaccharide/colanic/teichoic acid biosynthesis glycosyltransferase